MMLADASDATESEDIVEEEALVESSDANECSNTKSGGTACDRKGGDFKEAQKALWGSFDKGVKGWPGKTGKLDPDVKTDKDKKHGDVLCKRWRLWKKCKAQTMECAWMAGFFAEMLRRQAGTDTITQTQFEFAVLAVQHYQRGRMGANFIGIVC